MVSRTIKHNPTEWELKYKYRDKKTLVFFNTLPEQKKIKSKMKKKYEFIYVTYLYYNHDNGKYNLTSREIINQDTVTLTKLISYVKENFIDLLNREYKRRAQLTGKEFEALKILGFSLPENE